MTTSLLESLDQRHLHYFAVVAEELNLSRAARRLFISQPPLTRHIRKLEALLGGPLFERHTRGLTLTEHGQQVLQIIRPLLEARQQVFENLEKLRDATSQALTIGLTTAFEQGIFSDLENRLQESGSALGIVRESSPRLARDVRKGRLDAAFVALPLETSDLLVHALTYTEPLLAVLPTVWPEASLARLALRELSGRPLFWFPRSANPAFYDHARRVFALAEFSPIMREEPTEHDVLLARIAAGEGMGLLPASFSAIQRQGVSFTNLLEGSLLGLQLGLIVRIASDTISERLIQLATSLFATSEKNIP